MAVFCKDCRYFEEIDSKEEGFSYFPTEYKCNSPNNNFIKDTFLTRHTIQKSAKELNKNNDCTFFSSKSTAR